MLMQKEFNWTTISFVGVCANENNEKKLLPLDTYVALKEMTLLPAVIWYRTVFLTKDIKLDSQLVNG